MTGTLFAGTDNWAIWAILVLITAVSIYLEQHHKWAEKISAPILAIIIAFVLANVRIIPSSASAYSVAGTYFIPLALSMMLFNANIKKIIKNSGKMFICMNLGLVATLVGSTVAYLCLSGVLPESAAVAGGITGGFIGGTANILAVSASTGASETAIGGMSFSANFVMTLAIVALMWMPSSAFFKKHFNHPHQAELDRGELPADTKTRSAAFWGKKEISLLDIAKTVATAFVLVTIATKLANLVGGWLTVDSSAGQLAQLPKMVFGNQYVMLTLVSVIAVQICPAYFENLKGSHEIGTFLMYVYFAVIGCSVNMADAVTTIPLIIVFALIVAAVHLVVILLTGKLFKQNIEEITIASNANIGGPFTAAAMAVSKGYEKLIAPALLCGVWGNTLGTICGIVIATLLG